ncbi:MAG TPA: TRAM domain-containing protein, partial [Candidatus Omnitrophota bacterium]|nr:TRAM domain-containing protein [Candidatus Omnitrophota bacterium]
GKERSQAVGYLDDGTMVVVNNAQHKIGQTVKVKVGTVLQTQAGKMIFADFV